MAVPYRLLEKLCDAPLPLNFSEPGLEDTLRSNVSAGLVEATVPPAVVHRAGNKAMLSDIVKSLMCSDIVPGGCRRRRS